MKNTIRAFRLCTQKMEVKAAERVDEVFNSPLLIQKKKPEDMSMLLLKAIKDEIDRAYQEGLKFGKFIFSLAAAARKRKGKKVKKSTKRVFPDKKIMTLIYKIDIELQVKRFNEDMEMDSEKKRLWGWGKQSQKDYYASNVFDMEWKGLRNRLRQHTANYINHMADTGYYTGLFHG